MEHPPDPWADYLRRRGSFQADESFRVHGAGRREEVRADPLRPGAAMQFPFASASSRDFGNVGARQWLNGQMSSQLPGSFNGAPIFGGPPFGLPQGVPTGLSQGNPPLHGPPTFLATGAPIGTQGATATGPSMRDGGYAPGSFGLGPPTSSAFASTMPAPSMRTSAPGGVYGDSPCGCGKSSMSPGMPTVTGIDSAAGAAAVLDPPSSGSAANVKVDSAFEVLGMRSPNSSLKPADQAERFIAALTGEKRSIPTWQGQPVSLRTWLKLLAHWETETSVPREKWGIRLYQSFQESSEPRKIADQVPLQDVLTVRGYGLILSALMTKYKPYLDVAAPASIDKFFYAGDRQKGQTFAAFIASKEVARQELESHLQERIPDRVAARILMRQALLTDYQREMMALKDANQLFSWSQVISMLRPLDRPELIAQAAAAELGPSASKHYPVLALPDESTEESRPPYEGELWEEEEEEEMATDEELIFDFEDREYDEHEAMYIHAYHTAYSDVRRDLQNRRKERGFVRHSRPRGDSRGKGKGARKGGRGHSSSRSGPSRFNKMIKGSADELLSRTRCFNCKELGHYARDCPLKGGGGKSAQRGSPQGKQASFVVCRGGVDQTVKHAFMLSMPMLYATVKVKGSEALVDTAAEDAVVGDRAFEAMRAELATFALQPVWVESSSSSSMPCAGIGGAARTIGQADVPTCVAGLLGVLRFTILADSDSFQTPPLLPISYLEAIDAVIDLPRGRLVAASGRETPITRLPSGHRSVSIFDFESTPWQLPADLCADGRDPFQMVADAHHFSGVVQLSVAGASSVLDTNEPNNEALSSSAFAPTKKTTESTASPSTSTASGPLSMSSSAFASAKKTTESTASPSTSTASGPYRSSGRSARSYVESCRGDRVNRLEEFASDLFDRGMFDYKSIEEVIKRLPLGRKSATRDIMKPQGKQSGIVTFGLYAHGPMAGVTRATQEMAKVCRFVNQWISSLVPSSFTWSSVSIGVQTAADVHLDARNEGQSLNMSVSLGKFSNGELWVRSDEDTPADEKKIVWRTCRGQRFPGQLIDTRHKPYFFSPKTYHATTDWSGFRISVTAFTARSIAGLSDWTRDELEGLGFRLPACRNTPRQFVMSGGEEEDESKCSCVHDYEVVFESGKTSSSPRAASMFKRMLKRAAVWLSNSNSTANARHGQSTCSGGEDGCPGSRRPRGEPARGIEEVPCGVAQADYDLGDSALDDSQPDGGGPLDAAGAGGQGARADLTAVAQRQDQEEDQCGPGTGHRQTTQNVYSAQGVPQGSARVQPPGGRDAMPGKSSGEMVGVHQVRFQMGQTGGENNANGERLGIFVGGPGGEGGREGPQVGQHQGPRVPELPSGTPRTPATRSSSSDPDATGGAKDQQRDQERVEHWSCAFFHGAIVQAASEAHVSRCPRSTPLKDTLEDERHRGFRVEHGPRGLGGRGDDRPKVEQSDER